MSDTLGEQLAGWGKVAIVETTGRRSGRRVAVAVGFVETPDGTWLVAATSPDSHWARNLQAEPACRVRIGEQTTACEAEELAGRDRAAAVTGLILKYGTPSEGLGSGPAFRLRPVR